MDIGQIELDFKTSLILEVFVIIVLNLLTHYLSLAFNHRLIPASYNSLKLIQYARIQSQFNLRFTSYSCNSLLSDSKNYSKFSRVFFFSRNMQIIKKYFQQKIHGYEGVFSVVKFIPTPLLWGLEKRITLKS